MSHITKAIIPVAGWGTRRLPITRVVEKCMLPVGNRPVVDYIVEDCIKAGITDIYFVVSEGSTQLQSYYSANEKLNEYLVQNGKEQMIAEVTPPTGVNFHYVTQDTLGKYGTAIPVALVVQEFDIDESVVVLMGDDFIYRADGESEVARLIEASGDDSAMIGVDIPRDEVSRYGVIESDASDNFVRIVEKPTPEDAPSTLINVSKYVLNTSVLNKIVTFAESEHDGEYYITDPINDYVSDGGVLKVVAAEGQYLDSGTVEGWVKANNIVTGV
jgi:UTP--glucose-1-phosphate uridylyltransferase